MEGVMVAMRRRDARRERAGLCRGVRTAVASPSVALYASFLARAGEKKRTVWKSCNHPHTPEELRSDQNFVDVQSL